MKLFKNFFITIKTKGFIATFIAVKSFFIILLIFLASTEFLNKPKTVGPLPVILDNKQFFDLSKKDNISLF